MFGDRRGGWVFVCRACQQHTSALMRALLERNCNFWPRFGKWPRRVRERSEKCFKRTLSRLMSEHGPAITNKQASRGRNAPVCGQNLHIPLISSRFRWRAISAHRDNGSERFYRTAAFVDLVQQNVAFADKSWHRPVQKYEFYLSFNS